MYFYVEGTEAQRFLIIAGRLRGHLVDVVASGQIAGELCSSVSAEDVASLVFSVLASSVREWMFEEKPVAFERLATLRRRLTLLLRAFVPERSRATQSDSRPGRVCSAGSQRSTRPHKDAAPIERKQ
jgi:hypothetical protein